MALDLKRPSNSLFPLHCSCSKCVEDLCLHLGLVSAFRLLFFSGCVLKATGGEGGENKGSKGGERCGGGEWTAIY